MFILLFFSFSNSNSLILDNVIIKNNESDKNRPIIVKHEEIDQGAKGLTEVFIQEPPKHYFENLSLFSSHIVSEPNLEEDKERLNKETVVDKNNTKPFQDEKRALTDSEQKITEIAKKIKTQHPELYIALEKKAYEFYNKMQLNGFKDLMSLQEQIDNTSKKLVALKIRKDLKIVKTLLKEESFVNSVDYKNFFF
jgi:predicted transcriptional regulator